MREECEIGGDGLVGAGGVGWGLGRLVELNRHVLQAVNISRHPRASLSLLPLLAILHGNERRQRDPGGEGPERGGFFLASPASNPRVPFELTAGPGVGQSRLMFMDGTEWLRTRRRRSAAHITR